MRLASKQRGVALIELVIVIFIIGLLSSMVLVGYRVGQRKYILSGDARQLAANLRRIQNMAMSGVGVYGAYCGYGLEIDYSTRPASYRIYGDKALDCSSTNQMYDAGDDILETVNLSSNVEFQSTTFTPLDIFFMPPDPVTYINGNASSGRSASVVLGLTNDPSTQTITVTTAGLIQ